MAPRLLYAAAFSGRRAMASRRDLAALRQSCFEAYCAALALSSSYLSPSARRAGPPSPHPGT
eukprot:scaffold112803_cov57-Phaeocystis_antarctica.AAC.1